MSSQRGADKRVTGNSITTTISAIFVATQSFCSSKKLNPTSFEIGYEIYEIPHGEMTHNFASF
jgi:hypothetical protein